MSNETCAGLRSVVQMMMKKTMKVVACYAVLLGVGLEGVGACTGTLVRTAYTVPSSFAYDPANRYSFQTIGSTPTSYYNF